MPKTKEQKAKIVESLKQAFQNNEAAVLISFDKVKSDDLFALRNKIKKAGCLFKVAKKSLLEKALEQLGKKKLAEKIGEFKNSIALAFEKTDGLETSRICYNSEKEGKNIKILAGIIEGEPVDKEKIASLAKLPSRNELLNRLAGSMQAPLSRFAYVLEGNIKGLVYAFKAIINQKEKE